MTTSQDISATPGEEDQTGKEGNKKLTSKRIQQRLARVAKGEDARKKRKKRHKLAIALLEQIADGRIKNPQGAAQTYLDSLKQETEETQA